MNFFSRLIWAYRFAAEVPKFRQFSWTKQDSDQQAAWFRSTTGMKALATLQNKVTTEYHVGAATRREDITQQALGIWRAVCILKILSEDEPNLAQLSGIPAPAPTQVTKDSDTDSDPLDYLRP